MSLPPKLPLPPSSKPETNENDGGPQVVEIKQSDNVPRSQTAGSKWELKDDDGVPRPAHGIDRTTSIREGKDAYRIYRDEDIRRQKEHEKLQSLLAQDGQGADSRPDEAEDQPKGWFPWSTRLKYDSRKVNEPPLESLSRAARRKRIKQDIQKLGAKDEIDPASQYKPRRVW